MEKEKKVVKKPAKSAPKAAPKAKAEPKKPVKAQSKVEVEKVQVVEAPANKPAEQAKVEKKNFTLNQELNLIIGLFALMTIVSFCFAFQGGTAELLGWELFLKSASYSGVFKGLMILYVASLFIDCILAIRIDSENEVLNLIEKGLYMFTLVINFIVLAVLYSLISKVGIGLIIFLILSIISTVVKFARIYAQNK